MSRISRRYPTVADLLTSGSRLASAIEEKSEELSELQPSRDRLSDKLTKIRELSTQAAALQARKQETVQQIGLLQEEASRLMTHLHSGLKQHYGTRSEMLVNFGVQPFRAARRSSRNANRPSPAVESAADDLSQD